MRQAKNIFVGEQLNSLQLRNKQKAKTAMIVNKTLEKSEISSIL